MRAVRVSCEAAVWCYEKGRGCIPPSGTKGAKRGGGKMAVIEEFIIIKIS